MSLAFLTPETARPREVRARSPMERLALAAGARLSNVAGWNVANAYDDPTTEHRRLTQTVAFADRSSLTKLELQAEPAVLAAIVAQASAEGSADGLRLEPGLAGRPSLGPEHDTWWCPVTPTRVLFLAAPGAGAGLRASVAEAADRAAGSATVVDLTCGLAGLSLIGPGAAELLARFCAIDVRPAISPPGSFRPGSVARSPGYLLVEADDRLLVLVGWALGEYLWRVVADAAAMLGGGPVGAEALAHHRQDAHA